MKNTIRSLPRLTKLIAHAVLLFFCGRGFAQDTIRFTNGVVKSVKLLEVGPATVKYTNADNPGGPTYVCDKSTIAGIRYANGQTDSFSVQPAPLVELTAAEQKMYASATTPRLMVFGGGGLGLGFASPEHGQMRTFYDADLSVVYKKLICTFRYVKSEELQISSGWLFPEFNSMYSPIESTTETALLLGLNKHTHKYLVNASIGCSLQNNVLRDKSIVASSYPTNYEGVLVRHTIGFPLEAQAIRHWKYIGIGVKLYGNVNKVLYMGGYLLTLRLGYM